MDTNRLPITRNLSLAYTLSLVLAFLMAAMSLTGIFFQAAIYPTEELRQSFVSNDVVNIFIGLPILIGSMVLARRGRLIGLLFLPGHCSMSPTITLPMLLPCRLPCFSFHI